MHAQAHLCPSPGTCHVPAAEKVKSGRSFKVTGSQGKGMGRKIYCEWVVWKSPLKERSPKHRSDEGKAHSKVLEEFSTGEGRSGSELSWPRVSGEHWRSVQLEASPENAAGTDMDRQAQCLPGSQSSGGTDVNATRR